MEGKSPESSQIHDGEEVVIEDLKGKPMVGDITWVKLSSGSWWPALVVGFNSSGSDEDSDTLTEDIRVRLYGSFKYMLVDPTKWHSEFQITLNENNGCYQEIFRKALEQDISWSKSRGRRSKSKGTSNGKVSQERTISNHARSSSRKQPKHDGVKRKLKVDSPNTGGNSKRTSSKKDRMQKKHNGVKQNEDGELSGRSPELSARRIKVMQTLGLAAPSGSPYHN